MKEIVNKLHEKRQIELSKSILESKGYKVSKLEESTQPDIPCDKVMSNSEAITQFQNIIDKPELYGEEGGSETLDVVNHILRILERDKGATYYSDLRPTVEYYISSMIIDTGYIYIGTGYIVDEDGNKYHGYISGNKDTAMSFILPSKSVGESKELSEAFAPEFLESVEEFRDHIKKAFDILESTEEGILEAVVHDKLLHERLKSYLEQLNTNLYLSKKNNIKESSEDLPSQVKKALDDAGISYTVRGNGSLLVRTVDLRKASEIRNKIDPEYTVTIASRA